MVDEGDTKGNYDKSVFFGSKTIWEESMQSLKRIKKI